MVPYFLFCFIIGPALLREFSLDISSIESTKKLIRWSSYKITFKVTVSLEEDAYRMAVFEENLKYINYINSLNRGYILGLTNFAHWTYEEFLNFLSPHRLENTHLKNHSCQTDVVKDVGDVDWRSNHKVTPVRSQGKCGACYAFAGLAALESQIAIRDSVLMHLSVQQMIDCSRSFGNNGCDGGTFADTYKYIQDNGVYPEEVYLYQNKENICKASDYSNQKKYYIRGHTYVPFGNEASLSTVVHSIGPVAVGINASPRCFMFYREGIFESTECSPFSLNHAMLVVGLGSSPSPYYTLKNSWSTFWGENGYMRLARNKRNMCGVASTAAYPHL